MDTATLDSITSQKRPRLFQNEPTDEPELFPLKRTQFSQGSVHQSQPQPFTSGLLAYDNNRYDLLTPETSTFGFDAEVADVIGFDALGEADNYKWVEDFDAAAVASRESLAPLAEEVLFGMVRALPVQFP